MLLALEAASRTDRPRWDTVMRGCWGFSGGGGDRKREGGRMDGWWESGALHSLLVSLVATPGRTFFNFVCRRPLLHIPGYL